MAPADDGEKSVCPSPFCSLPSCSLPSCSPRTICCGSTGRKEGRGCREFFPGWLWIRWPVAVWVAAVESGLSCPAGVFTAPLWATFSTVTPGVWAGTLFWLAHTHLGRVPLPDDRSPLHRTPATLPQASSHCGSTASLEVSCAPDPRGCCHGFREPVPSSPGSSLKPLPRLGG